MHKGAVKIEWMRTGISHMSRDVIYQFHTSRLSVDYERLKSEKRYQEGRLTVPHSKVSRAAEPFHSPYT
jgi:hypothetical protein